MAKCHTPLRDVPIVHDLSRLSSKFQVYSQVHESNPAKAAPDMLKSRRFCICKPKICRKHIRHAERKPVFPHPLEGSAARRTPVRRFPPTRVGVTGCQKTYERAREGMRPPALQSSPTACAPGTCGGAQPGASVTGRPGRPLARTQGGRSSALPALLRAEGKGAARLRARRISAAAAVPPPRRARTGRP